MVNTGTLLGCAFASGDCFLETDERGAIGFASGATSLLWPGGAGDQTGRLWSDVLTTHTAALTREIERLGPTERAGPFRLAWSEESRPDLLVALFRNPKDGRRICWSIARSIDVVRLEAEAGPSAVARNAFDQEVERRANADVASVAALLDLRRSQIGAGQEAALDRALQSNALGVTGARLAAHRYAFVVDEADAAGLHQQLADVLGVETTALNDALALQELDGPNPALLRHALKLTMDRFTASTALDPANLTELFEAETRETQKRAAALQSRVRLRNFSLVYQPIVDLGSGSVHHSEALIRFRDGESPFEVIKFAEATGFIQELDWATINEALAQLRANPQFAPIAVNLSAQSLMAERFVSEIIATYRRVPSAKNRFLLEITESSALTELDAANAQIQRLRAAGIEIALDDFGAGASSLSYLQRLEVDTVKIDAEYIRNLVGAVRSRSIVQNIAQLCEGLGAATVGEGVETSDVADVLRTLGVSYGQGWNFGKPQPAPPIVARTASAAGSTPVLARRAKG